MSHTPESEALREKNSLAKHGVKRPQQKKEVKEKAKATNIERYGVEYPNQNKEVRDKGYKTNIERYGVAHPLQNDEIKKKAADSLEAKYGVRHPSLSPTLRNRANDSIEARYGVRSPWQSAEIKELIKESYRAKYGVDYPSQVPEIRAKALATLEEGLKSGRLAKGARVSKINRDFARLIEENFPDTNVTFEKTLGRMSFDLAIEGTNFTNFLIDINPTITHNNEVGFTCIINSCKLPCEKHSPVAQDYHYKRALAAKEAGYSLIQFFDWDSDEQILSLLRGKLDRGFERHSARKLQLVKISQKDANAFLKEAHIQGSAKGQSHCYGLKDGEGDLVAVATFAKARFKAKAEFEWVRYAVRGGAIVHGGPNRLFQAFLEDVSPDSVISYVDFNHTTAKTIFLSSCGFMEAAATGPSLVWSKDNRRIYNNSLLALGADRLLGTNYGRPEECGMKNNDIMLVEGWLPVYTAGNRVFMWTNSSSQALQAS